jgi:predicted ester cyclase
MRTSGLTLLCCIFFSYAHAQDMSTYKKEVTLWYEAFNTKAPALLDRILSAHWVDIPAAPSQPPGREGAKHLLVELTTTFPDLQVRIEEVLQEGNKVVVRSTITGTQSAPFMGFPAKNRTMTMHKPRQNFRYVYGWLSRPYSEAHIPGHAYDIMRADRASLNTGELA